MSKSFPVSIIDMDSASKPGDRYRVIQRFETVLEAEQWIGDHADQEKVVRGGFGIDAPEGHA